MVLQLYVVRWRRWRSVCDVTVLYCSDTWSGGSSGAACVTSLCCVAAVRGQVEALAQRVSVFDSIGSVLNTEIMNVLTKVANILYLLSTLTSSRAVT